MRSYIATLITFFCLLPLVAWADDSLPPKQMALDVITWARHGSDRFSTKYGDRPLFIKKKKFVLYGKIFEKMAEAGDLPKGYSVVTDETLKDIDWSMTGMIAINRQLPEGGFEVNIRTSPLGMCGYRIVLQDGRYNVHSNGGS